MSTPARFSDGQYKNWLKCSQSLIIMKEALHDYIDNEVKKLHGDITLKISSMYLCGSITGNQCGSCLSKNIELKKIKGVQHGTWYINCKKSICDKWLQQILAVHDEPHNRTINWKNADISKWPTDCYHVAKIFMPKGQDKTTKMPEDLDAPAILSLLKYCNWFRKDLPNTQILSDLIDIRNKVLHSGDLRVADSDKDSWIDMMIQLLSDLNICSDVHSEIQMLKKEDIDINFRETEIRVLQKMMSGLVIDLTTVKGDIASLQNSQSGLSEEMEKLRDNTTETTRKVDTVEADIEGMKKALEELKNISDKMASFFHKNPDIIDTEITKTIRNIGTDVQEVQINLFRVEAELKARVSSLEMQMEKHQEATKQQIEKHQEETKKQVKTNQEEVKERIEKHEEETKQQIEDIKKQAEGVERRLVTLEEEKKNDEQLSLQKDEAYKKTVEAYQEETQKHVKELSEKQEDMKKDIMYLQERQLEKSRQWDSLNYSKEVLDKHRLHADEFFVENQRYKTGRKILDLHGKIFITGKPGQGKTYLAYQVLLQFLKDKKNVSPLIISSADEWMKLADSSTELGIVVDDMCGKYGLLKGELKKWNENARFITALIEKRKHTVIFTMRTHIHVETAGGLQLDSDISDPLFSEDITIDLDNDSMNLCEADKMEFANKYLNKFSLTENEVLLLCRITEAPIGFPLLCRRAQSIGDKSQLFDLFSKPLEIMLIELERFFKEKIIFYGTLVLAVLSGGKFTTELINEFSANIEKKKEVKLIFYSYGGPDVKLADIQLAANALCGTYLLFNESDESYSFVHDTTEEAVFLSYGKLHPRETLKFCSLRSVCKLCRINNKSQGSKDIAPALMLDLRPGHHSILIERFIKELETKFPRNFATIAEANVWSSDHFRKLFMKKCKIIHILTDKDQNSLLVHAANANNCDLASELLLSMKQMCTENQQEVVSSLTKATMASCIHKDLCLFRQFMKTGNVNGNDILSLTVEKGSEEAMVFLLQNGADINYRSKNGESLLHTACLHARLHMVKLLQSKYSLLVNQCDNKGRSICHSAASGGSVDILNFIVQEGADPLCTDVDGMNLLHYACLEGKTEMALHLMDNYSVMLCNVGKGGYTVPHCAAYGGSIDIFNRICKLINVSS